MLLVSSFLALAGALSSAPALPSEISRAKDICRVHPSSVAALDRLAGLELKLYRQTHAGETLESAEKTIARALEIDSRDFDARRFRVSTLVTRHLFARAEAEGEALSEERPRDTDVLGMVADARMETGRYPQALETIQRMIDIRPGLPAYSRVSCAREIHGDLPGALAAMDMAIGAGDPSDPEAISWCLARSGSIAWKMGRLVEAEKRYLAAQSTFSRSPHAWQGLAQTAAARGDLETAARNLERAFAIVPWPQLAADRVDVAQAAGDAAAAELWRGTVRALETLSATDGLFNRAIALFEADHGDPGRAVEMTAAELSSRKDVYGWDAYAWALHRAGRDPEAAPAMREALARGTRDPLLEFHAAEVFAATGDSVTARRYLERVLATNPRFHPLFAARAENLRAMLESTVEGGIP